MTLAKILAAVVVAESMLAGCSINPTCRVSYTQEPPSSYVASEQPTTSSARPVSYWVIAEKPATQLQTVEPYKSLYQEAKEEQRRLLRVSEQEYGTLKRESTDALNKKEGQLRGMEKQLDSAIPLSTRRFVTGVLSALAFGGLLLAAGIAVRGKPVPTENRQYLRKEEIYKDGKLQRVIVQAN
mgnify:CR=1 FL=1